MEGVIRENMSSIHGNLPQMEKVCPNLLKDDLLVFGQLSIKGHNLVYMWSSYVLLCFCASVCVRIRIFVCLILFEGA